MPEKRSVSVIVPAYNRAHYLRDCLDSVLSQNFPNLEIVVVDDGSTDDTQQVLAEYSDKVVVVRQANSGFAAARSKGIARARSDLVAFVDSDDKMLPGRVQRQFAFMQTHQEVAVVSGNLVIQGMEDVDYFTRCGLDFAGEEFLVFTRPFQKLLGRNVMTDSGAMVRRQRFIDIGGYDLSLASSNDWDLWLRMGRRWNLACLQWPCTWVRRHSENMTSSPTEVRSNLQVVEKALQTGETIGADVMSTVLARQYNYLKCYLANCLVNADDPGWMESLALYARRLPWKQRLALGIAARLRPLARLALHSRRVRRRKAMITPG